MSGASVETDLRQKLAEVTAERDQLLVSIRVEKERYDTLFISYHQMKNNYAKLATSRAHIDESLLSLTRKFITDAANFTDD